MERQWKAQACPHCNHCHSTTGTYNNVFSEPEKWLCEFLQSNIHLSRKKLEQDLCYLYTAFQYSLGSIIIHACCYILDNIQGEIMCIIIGNGWCICISYSGSVHTTIKIQYLSTHMHITQQMLLKKLSAGKGVRHIIKVSKAEMKILFIMCYYIIFGVLYLVFLCLTTVTREKTRMALFDYFSCESESSNMQDCDSLNTAEVRFLDVLSIVVYFLLGMIPLVILIFGVNIKLKAIKKGMLMKYHQTSITFKSILSRQTVAVSTPSDLNESRIDQLE